MALADNQGSGRMILDNEGNVVRMNRELEQKLWNAGQTDLIYKKETWQRIIDSLPKLPLSCAQKFLVWRSLLSKKIKCGSYADSASKAFFKVCLTNSCQFSFCLILAINEGGTLTFICAVQDSSLSVVKGFRFSNFGLGFAITNEILIAPASS
ncbi:MAG: hypothetical protein QNJ72_28265 [Pleurocapsa sp. MO_226.B13]|nr:hypothetical protein [Pleurocapsa sp. MO_226.B13]